MLQRSAAERCLKMNFITLGYALDGSCFFSSPYLRVSSVSGWLNCFYHGGTERFLGVGWGTRNNLLENNTVFEPLIYG
jgi:hypothetical protein